VLHGYSRENDCGFSGETLEAMYEGSRTKLGAIPPISTSKLTSRCTRRVVLEATEDYEVKPQRLYDAFRGRMAHKVLENHRRPAPSWGERTVWMEHPFEEGDFLGGTPDRVDPDLGILWDTKSKKALPKSHWYAPYPSDAFQCQINALLVSNAKWVNPPGADMHGDEAEKIYKPVPDKTVMTATGTTKYWKPNPKWLPMEPELTPAHYGMDWEHFYIEYLDFEGSLILEVREKRQFTGKAGRTYNRYVPDIWPEEVVLERLETAYQAIKAGFADPKTQLPPIPEDLVGWPMDNTSPCLYCDVREACQRIFWKEDR